MSATVADAPRLERVQCLDPAGLRRVAWWEWGDPANPRVVVCAHGLARQGRDFDTLARALRDEFRIVCPDIAGRGESDRIADPALYRIPTYVADMVTLLARLRAEHVAWLGTSMGGLIGIALASLPGSPVERLVVNDIGPTLDATGIARIGAYIGQPLSWASEDEAADYLFSISAGFGRHSRDEWMALSRPMLRPVDDDDAAAGGSAAAAPRWRLHYDPAIGVAMRGIDAAAAALGERMLWAAWDAIRCPTLLLRGADSDILSAQTAAAMVERGPKPRLHEFDGVGHAPMLVRPEQVAIVREFLGGAAGPS